jgi:hypothetical protein
MPFRILGVALALLAAFYGITFADSMWLRDWSALADGVH